MFVKADCMMQQNTMWCKNLWHSIHRKSFQNDLTLLHKESFPSQELSRIIQSSDLSSFHNSRIGCKGFFFSSKSGRCIFFNWISRQQNQENRLNVLKQMT